MSASPFSISASLFLPCKQVHQNHFSREALTYIHCEVKLLVTQFCLTLWDPWTIARQASLFITNSRSLLKLIISSSAIPFSSCLQSFPASGSFPMSQFFTSCGQSIGFQLQHRSFQWTSRTSFRMDWLDPLAVQGTFKSLLQHHSSKASVLQCSALFIVQLSHPYMTIGKTVTLTRWTFVGKGMSLLFNMLSRLIITFLPRSKCLLIS